MNKILPEEENAEILMKYLKKRMNANKNWLCVTTGSPGSGKSYADLRIGELWYDYWFQKDFPVSNSIFSIEQMMRKLNHSDLQKGELFILEEAGALINAKDFMSQVNRLFNFYMQSFRCRNVLLIFNLPIMEMMDKSTRLLVHSHFVTSKIDKNKKLCSIRPYFTQVNQQTGKVYRKFLRTSIIRGQYYFKKPLERVYLSIPSENLRNEYEKKKKLFVEALGENIIEKLQAAHQKPLTPLQDRMWEYATSHPGCTLTEIAKAIDEPSYITIQNCPLMERKGWNIKKFLKKWQKTELRELKNPEAI